MHYRISLMTGLLVLGSSAFALAQSPAPAMSPGAMAPGAMAPGAMAPGTVAVKLGAQNGSGETGTALLSQAGNDVKVVVTMTGATVAQPIHVHDGTCAKLDPKPKYPLTTVMDGKSTTTLKGMKLADLETGAYAINVHKSTTDVPTYVACGDIPKAK